MLEQSSDSSETLLGEDIAAPYPGLRPFFEDETRLFFGREQEKSAMLALLEDQQLLVVHGASGCGKSSVVRAGVVPIFRLDARANSREDRVIIFRPADAGGPLQSLARKLEREFPRSRSGEESRSDPDTSQSWSSLLAASPDLARDISKAARDAGASLCIVIDQFEEIFIISRDDYAAEVRRIIDFLNSLAERAEAGRALGGRHLSVVLTMRSDYLGHCARWDGFAETVNRCQYLLPKISTVGLLKAIHEPARRAGAVVTEGVADRLLPVIAREIDGLPILQHALARAWQVADTVDGVKTIDEAALESVGGAKHALSRHAEEALELATKDDPKWERTVEWIFRSLSDLDSDARIVRRSIPLAQLVEETGSTPGEVRAILDVFRGDAYNLVMPLQPEPLDQTVIVSVSHEALLRQWDRITDPQFDLHGRPIGLVNREFQDGMIWRSLALQAETFARDRESVLGAAATEQLLPWYQEIKERPGWVNRYRPKGNLTADETAEAQWRRVQAFMDASKANWDRENQLVHRLRRIQRLLAAMTALVVVLAVAVGLVLKDKEYKAQDRADKAQNAAQAANETLRTIFANDVETAGKLAEKFCGGRNISGDELQKCLNNEKSDYIQQIQEIRDKPLNSQNLPLSPLGGGGSLK